MLVSKSNSLVNNLLAHQKIQNIENILRFPYESVGEMLLKQSVKYGEKSFVMFPGLDKLEFSYRSFARSCIIISQYLRGLGLSSSDRFSLIANNSFEFLVYYFSGLINNITVVPINPELTPVEMEYIVRDSESKVVIYDVNIIDKIKKFKLFFNSSIIFKSMSQDKIHKDKIKGISLTDDFNYDLVKNTDEAVIIYTSGTTGNPKGVILTHLNLLVDAQSISEWFQFNSNTRTLCILPLFHNNAQVTTLLAPLYAGGSTVMVKGKASINLFWDIINYYNVTWTSVMSSILSILLDLPTDREDESLEGILCGGQILTESVQKSFEGRFNVPIFEGYGLTETTSFSCINTYPAHKRRKGSIGNQLPCNEIKILNDNNLELCPYDIGQICIRGLNVAKGYLNLEEKNNISFSDGWFHSGDYGYVDEDGYFFFQGRKDSLIIKGGENIYPAEIENVFYDHPEVIECAAVGIPDKLLGEDICVFVKCRIGSDIEETDLIKFCSDKIAGFKQAKFIILINKLSDMSELPKGPTKKVLYHKLKDYYINNFSSRI